MNIEFDKLRQVCIHSNGKAVSKCFKTGSQCVEQNCPLKAEDVAVRMSNGVVQEIFAPLKAEEKVCRWVRREYYDVDSRSVTIWTEKSCGNEKYYDDIPIFCHNCGGKVVME